MGDWSRVNFWMGKVTLYQYKLEVESILRAHASSKGWVYKRNQRRICGLCYHNGSTSIVDLTHLGQCPFLQALT